MPALEFGLSQLSISNPISILILCSIGILVILFTSKQIFRTLQLRDLKAKGFKVTTKVRNELKASLKLLAPDATSTPQVGTFSYHLCGPILYWWYAYKEINSHKIQIWEVRRTYEYGADDAEDQWWLIHSLSNIKDLEKCKNSVNDKLTTFSWFEGIVTGHGNTLVILTKDDPYNYKQARFVTKVVEDITHQNLRYK